VTHEILPDDFARSGVAWSGPPLPLSIGVGPVHIEDDDLPGFLSEVTRRSLLNVLARSRIVEEVREADGPPRPGMDLVLKPRLLAFDLYTTYAWWALYGGFLVSPLPGSAVGTVMMLVAGCPIISDCAEIVLEVDVEEARTGRRVARYRAALDLAQHVSIYGSPSVNESYVSHPEMIFQTACGRIAHEIGRDRFWLLRFRAGP
jgi:hypothetical protein